MPDDDVNQVQPPIQLIDNTLIAPIELDDAQGRWTFEPQADITALEAVLISHMFSAIAIRHLHGKFNRWDWREYLTRERSNQVVALRPEANHPITTPPPDLARHFRQVE
jgi:hypothetical protein